MYHMVTDLSREKARVVVFLGDGLAPKAKEKRLLTKGIALSSKAV